ncbi:MULTISPECIES: hypothetical protein [unclassified Lysinibacillus]|uniref:hypothetical protein n=1 Tax=unclassified Lysinibacillus TaxID=2636778 RepID=UPI003810A3D0
MLKNKMNGVIVSLFSKIRGDFRSGWALTSGQQMFFVRKRSDSIFDFGNES